MRNFNNSRRPSNGPRRDSAERGAAGSHERRSNNSGRRYSSEGRDERRSSYGHGKFQEDRDRREEREGRPERRYSRNSGGFKKNYSNNRPDRDTERPRFNKSGRNSYTPKPAAFKPQEKESDGIRLNKYISNSGVCSRREADEYIKAGLVSVNGQIVNEMGVKVTENDDVRFNGERLKGEAKVYILMNKPKDVVTTVSDPHAETTVIDLIRNKCDKRVFPVGRLDKATTGVLLLTNDGELTEKLTHPSFEKKKIYHVFLDRKFHGDDMKKLVDGITLEDGPIHVDTISYVDECKDQVGVEIHSGRNRIVRRMFEHLGYKVKKLDRVYFAGLTKRKLRRGEWRYLTDKEVSMLMMGAFE